MKITENIIRSIVKETLYNLLNEGTNMQTLYHFTSLKNLNNIIKENALKLSDAEIEIRNGYNFASLTRNRALGSFGNVRIQFDAIKLNSLHNIKIQPFDFFNKYQDKRGNERWERNGSSESEESILSKKINEVKNICKCIERIDILYTEYMCKEEDLDEFRYNADKLRNCTYVYTNKKDFLRQNNRCENFDNFMNGYYYYKRIDENKKIKK